MVKLKQSTKKQIFVGVAIIILAGVGMNFINAIGEDYADVKYQLFASEVLNKGETLQVNLKLTNEGNLDIVPTSTIFVENATIEKVEIKGVRDYQLSDFCTQTSNKADITNLMIEAGKEYSDFATIYVAPNEGVTSFGVYSEVNVPENLVNPNNVMGVLPTEFVYGLTGQDEYKLLN